MRAWRRDVGTLVGAPAAAPAFAVGLEAVTVLLRRVHPQAGWLPAPSHELTVRAALSALPFGDASIAALMVSFLGSDGRAHAVLLAELARVSAPDAVLVAVDHNRPRRRAAALVAVVAPPRPFGRTPAARWRRLAHPTAREMWVAGFTIERLRLVAGERVQVVFARRAAPQNFAHQGVKCLPGTSTTTEY
jgi:hypothetical protein